MTSRELNILIKAKNLAGNAIAGVKRDLRGLDKTLGKGISNAARNIERGIMVGVAAFGAGVAYSLKAAGDFEAQMNTINTVARQTPEGLKQIGDGIRALARETGTPLEEITAGYYDLVSAGIDAAHAQDVLRASVTLSIGGLSTAGEAIDLLTTAVNSYGGDAAQAGRYADIFAKSIEQGKVTAADLASTFAQIAPLAAANNIEIEELAAGYALLTAKGVPASEAATQMRSALVALMRRTADLKKLETATGKSYLAIAGKKGLVAALEELRIDAAKTGKPIIDFMGRIEGLSFLVNTTGDAFDDYTGSLEAMTDSQGTAAAQMAERQKGLNFQIARLKANAHDAAITIGTALIPMVADLAGKVADWAEGHQPEVQKFAEGLAKAFQDAVKWAGKFDWSAVMAGLQTARDVIKTVLDTFLRMPAWVQTAIVTGWGLNKLTGGMVGTLVGQLGAGLIRGVLGINAGVVNINAAVVNGGVPGVGGAPVAGAAGRAGAGLVIARFLGVGSAVALGAVLGNVIGRELFFKPTVQPAIDFETGIFEDKKTGSAAQLAIRIDAVTQGIEDLNESLPGGLAQVFLAEELAILEGQKAILEKELGKVIGSQEGAAQINEESQRVLDQIKAETAKTAEEQRVIRANTASSARWAGLANSNLATIAGKNFSPNVNVTASLTNIVSVSAQQVVKTTTRIAGTTTIGGFIETY